MSVQCECGEAMGEPCAWSGPRSATVVVEWMPPQHRSSHSAAGNAGSYPHNGAVRLRCERSCAERIGEADGEWARIIGRPALGRRKVLVSLPPELLARLDERASARCATRSQAIEVAVRAWLTAADERRPVESTVEHGDRVWREIDDDDRAAQKGFV